MKDGIKLKIWLAMSTILFLLTLWIGQLIVIGFGLMFLAIGGFALGTWNADYYKLKRWRIAVGVSYTLALIVIISALFAQTTTTHYYTTESHDVYYASAPFGILWRETEGHFVFGCGSIQTQLTETCTVKYMVGNELKTFNAKFGDITILVDGSFKFEQKNPMHRDQHWLWGTHEIPEIPIVYVLHIPALPNINGTTEQYTIVG